MDPWMWRKEAEVRRGERDRMVSTLEAVGNWRVRWVSWGRRDDRPVEGDGGGGFTDGEAMPMPKAPRGPGAPPRGEGESSSNPRVCEML